MKILYVLGNGFDMYHGLKTQYADFHRFVSEHHVDLETKLENYFDFQVDADYLWKFFERDLCNFNYKSFFEDLNHLDIMDDGFKPSQCLSLADDIAQQSEELVQCLKDALSNWIEAVEYPTIEFIKSKLLHLQPESVFINFNYTDTLEELYQIPKNQILYLHNNASDFSGELIIGHTEKKERDPKADEMDANGDSNRTMFTDAEDAARTPFYELQKDTDTILADHDKFFEKLSSIEQIIVLGHSLGKVDWPYFQKIATIAPKADWSISYFHAVAKRQAECDAIEMLSYHNPVIHMIQIGDLNIDQ